MPLLVEVKSEWDPPDTEFMKAIGHIASGYSGPIALMSFDPDVMAALKEVAPSVPRGIVSGIYGREKGWWHDRLSEDRAWRLSHLLESARADPQFYAYHVAALPTPVTRFVREVLGLPLYAWTVRGEDDVRTAARWADAPIFEGW